MLTFALLMSARMGIFQEILYKEYGKHSKEALFYNVSGLCAFFAEDTPTAKQLWGPQTSVSSLPVCSTACLCPASCCSSLTSTTTASSSAKAVSLAFDALLFFPVWFAFQPDTPLLPSSRPGSGGGPLRAHHVALPAAQHPHPVSCPLLSYFVMQTLLLLFPPQASASFFGL